MRRHNDKMGLVTAITLAEGSYGRKTNGKESARPKIHYSASAGPSVGQPHPPHPHLNNWRWWSAFSLVSVWARGEHVLHRQRTCWRVTSTTYFRCFTAVSPFSRAWLVPESAARILLLSIRKRNKHKQTDVGKLINIESLKNRYPKTFHRHTFLTSD